MNAEARCLVNNNKAIIFLNVYSAALIIISILSMFFLNEIDSLISIILSIFIMAISIILAFMDFKEQANQYKISYLELMKLEEDLSNLEIKYKDSSYEKTFEEFKEIKKKYIKILQMTPNHKEIDYQKSLKDTSNCKISINSKDIIFNLIYYLLLILPIGYILLVFLGNRG